MSQPQMAFGVDPKRRELYSLRQSRYYSLAEDVSRMAAAARREGRRLKLLDIGVKDGVSRRYIEVHPDTEVVDYYGADLELSDHVYKHESWKKIFIGDLMQGYPEIADDMFDIVICEQVLEHLPQLELATQTLSRVLKPGGVMFIGVPTYPHGLHLIRKYIVPALDAMNPWAKQRGHVQAFSSRTFSQLLRRQAGVNVTQVRGFRIISGGILRPLENQRWWWQLNRTLGAIFPGLCIEVQAVAQKPLQAAAPAQRRAA